MSQVTLALIADAQPAAICAHLKLTEPGRAALQDDPSPNHFLTRLSEQGLWADAIAYLSAALPPVRSVAWACACIRLILTTDPMPKTLLAAETWVADPTEERRREAETAAGALDELDSGAAFAAIAAFWAGDSIAPADLPPVPPPPGLCATGVNAALTLAATSGPADQIAERYRQFVGKGILIASESPNTGADPIAS